MTKWSSYPLTVGDWYGRRYWEISQSWFATTNQRWLLLPDKGFFERSGTTYQDPRKPRTASNGFYRGWSTMEFRNKSDDPILFEKMYAKQQIEKTPLSSLHFDFIPNPNAIADGSQESNALLDEEGRILNGLLHIFDNNSPFDPHLHGDMTSTVKLVDLVIITIPNHHSSIRMTLFIVVVEDQEGIRLHRPTEGPYPTSVLPQPQFNLGVLGFSNGGWTHTTMTNRPKRMLLQGLRNSWE